MAQQSDQSAQVDPLEQAALQGMVIAYVAARMPDKLAVASPFGQRTFAQLNSRVNQLARLMRQHGIGEGDSMALVSKNRPAFVEAYLAALRTGVRFTPVNFHLTAEEVGYVIDDCYEIGYYGAYGGRFVPETLVAPVTAEASGRHATHIRTLKRRALP